MSFPIKQLADVGDVRPPWRVAGDGWVWRPVRSGDSAAETFADSCHAFREAGRLYCRNAEQAAGLDRGILPANPRGPRGGKL